MRVSTDRRLSLIADADYFLALVDHGLLKKITTFPDTHRVAITDFSAYELARQTSGAAQRATEFISRHPHLIMTYPTDIGAWFIHGAQTYERSQTDAAFREVRSSFGLEEPSELPLDAGYLAGVAVIKRLDGTEDALHGAVRVSTPDYPDAFLESLVNATTPIDTNTVPLGAFARQMKLAEQIMREDVEILKVLAK